MNWPENPTPPSSSNFSWETSSTVSEATVENLASGLEELEAQQAKMMDATTKLLSVVSEAGGGPWSNSPGLTKDLLSIWLGVQEDRWDELRYKVMGNKRSWPGGKKWGRTISSAPPGMGKVWVRPSSTATPLAGPTRARAPEYKQAGTKINKPRGKVEEEKETGPSAPGKPQRRQGRPEKKKGKEEIRECHGNKK